MTPKEIAACRTSLGALQWLAVQSQPLITARCNLLITELSTDPKIQIAQELQEMIRELRKRRVNIEVFQVAWRSSLEGFVCGWPGGPGTQQQTPWRVDGRHDSFPVRP